ncbi:Hsp20/alpha crystallin family protein [Natrialbaceae archaeon AArc-T1-2]|uniref:Hsp20/alpha crystallin family protein n=1 Tax=Natrialbaceae archaeon AArc-T1-2 TaxID=3053904 RepID=UPI00255B14DA|nr:Hsp20/alpha crystallin family protein [Natrialbaceae archaeon AArc-T1-2]WIV68374.1 Hsp20/alpha crystallin family protein [Natrialbaceae archaeon AArc-T1-2]
MRPNPFEELEDVLERVSRQIETGMSRGTGFPVPGEVAVDVLDADDAYVVTADLPGYETGDIELTLSEGTLRLEATRDDEHEEGRYIRRERTRRSASRTLRIPEPVEEDEVSASYDDGVLTVELPKEDTGEETTRIDVE